MKTITPSEAQQIHQEKKATLLDVRTAIEFEEKHIAGSQHLPLDQLPNQLAQLKKGEPLILICAAGKRAEKACQILAEQDYPDLHVMTGGIASWESAGLPLNRTERKVLPLMRQVQLTIGLGVLTFSLLAYFVNPAFAFGSAFFGAGLTLAGSTGWCGLALLLAKMPWNKTDAPAKACCAA